MALVLAFLSVENENRQLEDFPRADFGRLLGRLFNQKTSSVGKDKVNKLEFCKLKITTIVVFVVVIQRILFILGVSANALYDCYSGIVDSFIFIQK